MTFHKIKLLAFVIAIATASSTQAQDYSNYLSTSEMPYAGDYLPAPPDTASAIFAGDYAMWVWGKSVRNTPRGQQASWESKFGIERMSTVFGEALGITINEDETPAIYKLMYRAGNTACNSVATLKTSCFRKRPFVQMNEAIWGEFDIEKELRPQSSYPSSHTALGWGTALVLAEMAPNLQDTILRRGYEYGISRVIVGAHWLSDVIAAMHCASSAIMCMHNNEEFLADLQAARQEYMQIKGLTVDDITADYPLMKKILDAPPMPGSNNFIGDLFTYWQAKQDRDGERGNQAIIDASLNDDDMFAGFGSCSDITISDSETPNIAMLIKMAKLIFGVNASGMKNDWFRNRPYVQFAEPTAIASEESEYRKESSYPSGHAMISWGIALSLAEVMPSCAGNLLKRGYEMGWSRVITGYHYNSDVEAGRLMAACDLVKLHNVQFYQNLLNAAKEEYAQKKAEQGIETIINNSLSNPNLWYSISGIIYNSHPTQPGIYIHNGTKVTIK